MKTAIMMAGVCLLVLTFSTAKCGSAREKKQVAVPGGPTISTDPSCALSLDNDFIACFSRFAAQRADGSDDDDSFCGDCRSVLEDYGRRCADPASLQQGLDALNALCGDAKILGASLFSTILALLVAAVASTLN